MPTVLLVRHGQASFGTGDYDVLSELGERQARVVGEALAGRGVRPRLVRSGGLRRQIDTAALAAGAGWPEAEADRRWDEYSADEVLSFHSASAARLERGEDAAGPELSTREFQTILDEALDEWVERAAESPAPGSWPGFQEGAWDALRELAGDLGRGEVAVVFTSAGTIAAVSAAVLELPPRSFVALNRVQVNTAITKVAFGASGASLLSFNEHAHLESGGRSMITFR